MVSGINFDLFVNSFLLFQMFDKMFEERNLIHSIFFD